MIDISSIKKFNFSISQISNTNKFLVTYSDGSADIMSRKELIECYGEIVKLSGGAFDSPEKIEEAIMDLIVKDSNSSGGLDIFDESPEKLPLKIKSFDMLDY
jgi:hypothetical protein